MPIFGGLSVPEVIELVLTGIFSVEKLKIASLLLKLKAI